MILGGLSGLVVILLLFCLWHAAVALGPRLALAFFAITAVTSFLFEEAGVVTGLVFGPYHYTQALGPWLGSVPIVIPLAWFVLVYPGYILANLIVGGWPVGTPGGRGRLVGMALLGALVMAAGDLLVDPLLSGPAVGAWVWERGGPWYGVPLQNSLGWIVTAFTVYVLYRWLERSQSAAGGAAVGGAAVGAAVGAVRSARRPMSLQPGSLPGPPLPALQLDDARAAVLPTPRRSRRGDNQRQDTSSPTASRTMVHRLATKLPVTSRTTPSTTGLVDAIV